MKYQLFVGILVLLLLSVSAFAGHVEMTPGLWEHTVNLGGTKSDPAQEAQMAQMKAAMDAMKKEMANMSPEQRAQLEKMMGGMNMKVSDGGVAMGGGKINVTDNGVKIKVCLTKEQAEKGYMPSQSENSCVEKFNEVTASSVHVVYDCVNGATHAHGESELQFQNSKSYTGKSKVVTTGGPMPMTMESQLSGKWLASDCGDIKPIDVKLNDAKSTK